jgi:hypothetical protein
MRQPTPLRWIEEAEAKRVREIALDRMMVLPNRVMTEPARVVNQSRPWGSSLASAIRCLGRRRDVSGGRDRSVRSGFERKFIRDIF